MTTDEVRTWLEQDYPNLAAIMAGCTSGHHTEWPMVRSELERLVASQRAEIDSLRDYKNALIQAHDIWKSQWQEAQVEIDRLQLALKKFLTRFGHYSYPEIKLAQDVLDGKDEYLDTYVKDEIEQLKHALQFYADPQTYGLSGGSVDRILNDKGQRAKQALREVEVS